MARISLWNNGLKGLNYQFQDRQISKFFYASGTPLYVTMYLGVYDQTDPATLDPNAPVAPDNVMAIQDFVTLENRDRKYATEHVELFGCYNVQDNDLDMKQFGFFMTGDTLFIEVHINDMLALMGRKIMTGDVIELPHLRDDTLLDPGAPAINKFYVVEDASRASGGYSSTWLPHVWRIKLAPMTGAQEYADILDRGARDPFGLLTGDTLRDILTNEPIHQEINDQVVAAAELSVKARYFETRQFYVVPGDERGSQNPWIFAGDGIPPNGAVLTGTGNTFPVGVTDGTYYLRTDRQPSTLFRFENSRWKMQEVDYRQGTWSAANTLISRFINNNNVTTNDDGTTMPEKQMPHLAILPKADF